MVEGDVRIGLNDCLQKLANGLRLQDKKDISWGKFYASSSAAGGLRITVHGLVIDMTTRAAKEAALGAGAIVKKVTAGLLSQDDIREIESINPNLIILAGGIDFGEKDTIIENARLLSTLKVHAPVIYAGNCAASGEVVSIFKSTGKQVTVTDNCYPNIDEFNIEPTRHIIQKAFEENIVKAPGMDRIRELVDSKIIPTPASVMNISSLLADKIGDLMVIDIGGATTDVHSVTEGSKRIRSLMISPEPKAKRTVEGDIGVYINLNNMVKVIRNLYSTDRNAVELVEKIDSISGLDLLPNSEEQVRLYGELARFACLIAVDRHAGGMREFFGPYGKKQVAYGKDLTAVKYLIGTGGLLSRNRFGRDALEAVTARQVSNRLYPPSDTKILVDNNYMFSTAGLLVEEYPRESIGLVYKSLGLKEVKEVLN